MTRCRICNADEGPCASHQPDNDGYSQNERDDAAEHRENRARDRQW